MKITRKILIFPLILIITFGAAYYTLNYFNKVNKNLLNKSKNVYLPCIEKSIKIHHNLFEIQKSLQDAVASAETEKLNFSDSLAREFKILCKSGIGKKENEVYIDSIYTHFDIYYSNARNICSLMIENDISEKLSDEISIMLQQYNQLSKMIERLEKRSKNQTRIHFEIIEKNNRKSAVSNIIIIIFGLFVSFLTAVWVSSAISKPLIELNTELKKGKKELAKFINQLSIKNDELTQKNIEIEVTLNRLKETQAQLILSEKMASLGVLTAGVAHEINNPLNFILGGKTAIETYLDEFAPQHKAKLQNFLSIIDTGISRANTIVKSLNRYSRTTDSFNEECNIHLILENCLEILKYNLKHKIEIIKKYSTENIIIRGNENKLHQIFLNIISNSEQAISEKGYIEIKTESKTDFVLITFSDNGCGISTENLNRITDPFFTTKDPGKGTGLGLYITLQIINEHNGEITFDSQTGKGTKVTVKLPKRFPIKNN